MCDVSVRPTKISSFNQNSNLVTESNLTNKIIKAEDMEMACNQPCPAQLAEMNQLNYCSYLHRRVWAANHPVQERSDVALNS